MTTRGLVIRVHLLSRRFHGSPEWPPSPARLFQALVAGASARLGEAVVDEAFHWLERQSDPSIGTPRHRTGAEVTLYVPNNDLDTCAGDPGRVAELRTAKLVRPRLLQGDLPLLYAWSFSGDDKHARVIEDVSTGLYQFGRGVDMAYATTELCDERTLDAIVSEYPGVVYRPTPGGYRGRVAAPRAGTYESLMARHRAQGVRFRSVGVGKQRTHLFVQPPKGLFREVSYGSPPRRFLFEIRTVGESGKFAPAALSESHRMVMEWRDAAVSRLEDATGRSDDIAAVLIGRRPGEPERVPSDLRIRLIPLPSVGHSHADRRIRRLLVEVPQGGPFSADDIRWAFSGLERDGRQLIEADDAAMATHYQKSATVWRTVTPAALPVSRRRIEPSAQNDEAKGAPERSEEEARAIAAVHQALRHAGIDARGVDVDVQREPWEGPGERAESFAVLPRFPKERLWHVCLRLDRGVPGPLVIGDGRFVGLGVCVPRRDEIGCYAWSISSGLENSADPITVASHLRRAVIANAQQQWGKRSLPAFITGHRPDGSPAIGHEHLYFVADLARLRLLVIAPSRGYEDRLAVALDQLTTLRSGRAGRLELVQTIPSDDDAILGRSHAWRSVTPYRVNRHSRRRDAQEAVAEDVRADCRRLELPEPEQVEVSDVRAERGVGLEASVRIRFAVAIEGPLLLGRTRHRGGGLFERVG